MMHTPLLLKSKKKKSIGIDDRKLNVKIVINVMGCEHILIDDYVPCYYTFST